MPIDPLAPLPKVSDYRLISNTPEDLAGVIKQMLAKGWELHGSPMVLGVNGIGATTVAQAMILRAQVQVVARVQS